MITRFAPSPTGYLHLGHAFSAWSSWRLAPAGFLLRLEDIDAQRCRPAFAAAILEDLAWLGLHWVGAVRVQSAHMADYGAALARLAPFTFPCFCSRAEIARQLSAPHGVAAAYPGTCRGLGPAERADRIAAGAPYAVRLHGAAACAAVGPGRYHEQGVGWVDGAAVDDVVLARRDLPVSYHLCVTHDDAAQGVTDVVRGEDLRAATPVHVTLQRLLGYPTPRYRHHALLRGADGRRLAKRDQAASLREMRAAGVSPDAILKGFEGL